MDYGNLKQLRTYEEYQQYLLHQAEKVDKMQAELLEFARRTIRGELKGRLQRDGTFSYGDTVLCLGARRGDEVKVFRDLGCLAIGIDVNPGEHNSLVTYGDFHDVGFSDGIFHGVFTNSFDHSLYPDLFMEEVIRVLRPAGYFVAEFPLGKQEGFAPEEYEVIYWDKVQDAIDFVTEYGLEFMRDEEFTSPWKGRHVLFWKRS